MNTSRKQMSLNERLGLKNLEPAYTFDINRDYIHSLLCDIVIDESSDLLNEKTRCILSDNAKQMHVINQKLNIDCNVDFERLFIHLLQTLLNKNRKDVENMLKDMLEQYIDIESCIHNYDKVKNKIFLTHQKCILPDILYKPTGNYYLVPAVLFESSISKGIFIPFTINEALLSEWNIPKDELFKAPHFL